MLAQIALSKFAVVDCPTHLEAVVHGCHEVIASDNSMD